MLASKRLGRRHARPMSSLRGLGFELPALARVHTTLIGADAWEVESTA
jgi:hypothetical protein